MKLITENGFTIIQVPVRDFKLEWFDKPKKSGSGNYVNANFFGSYDDTGYSEDGSSVNFTLPSGNLICDVDQSKLNTTEAHYMLERGSYLSFTKWYFNSYKWKYLNNLYGKATTNFYIRDNKAYIEDLYELGDLGTGVDYAVAGIPCLRNGNDVKWKTYVSPQGWDASSLRATTHIFLGLTKSADDNVYIIIWKSMTNNLIYSAEFYNAISSLTKIKFKDIIKLDGGGSYICRSEALGINDYTSENRRINCIIRFDETATIPVDDNGTVSDLPTRVANLENEVKDIKELLKATQLSNEKLSTDIASLRDYIQETMHSLSSMYNELDSDAAALK